MSSMTLSELLHKKHELYEAESKKNRELIEEWVGAVDELFRQLRGWIAILDPEKFLQLEDTRTLVNEPSFGRYQAPRLEIRAFGIWVAIVPKARMTVRTARPPQFDAPEHATGRVDITDEVRRYILYRLDVGQGNSWFIEGPSDADPHELTQARFEDALKSYFR